MRQRIVPRIIGSRGRLYDSITCVDPGTCRVDRHQGLHAFRSAESSLKTSRMKAVIGV